MDTKHCLNCPYHKTQYDQYGAKYCYCFHAGFGRWVAEIKECPIANVRKDNKYETQ